MTFGNDDEVQNCVDNDDFVMDIDFETYLSELDDGSYVFDADALNLSPADLPGEELIEMSRDLQPVTDPIHLIEDDSQDILINPKEWLVTDEKNQRSRPPLLYEFLLRLVQNDRYKSYASFTDEKLGIFKVHQPHKVAELWQQVKNRQSNGKMTYDKLARGVRDYYSKNIMLKTNTRHTFRFSEQTLAKRTTGENNNACTDSQ